MLVHSYVTLCYNQSGNKIWLIPSHHQTLFQKLSIKTLTAARCEISSFYKNCHTILVKIQYILECKMSRCFKCIKSKNTNFCRQWYIFSWWYTCSWWSFVAHEQLLGARCWLIFNWWILRLPISIYSEGFLIINVLGIDSFYNSCIAFCLVENSLNFMYLLLEKVNVIITLHIKVVCLISQAQLPSKFDILTFYVLIHLLILYFNIYCMFSNILWWFL
jgi:hypothetical protein